MKDFRLMGFGDSFLTPKGDIPDTISKEKGKKLAPARLPWYMRSWVEVIGESPWPAKFGWQELSINCKQPIALLGISILYWGALRRKYFPPMRWWKRLTVPWLLVRNWLIHCYTVLTKGTKGKPAWVKLIIWRGVPMPQAGE